MQLHVQLKSSAFGVVAAIASCFHVLVWLLVVAVSLRHLHLRYFVRAHRKSAAHTDQSPSQCINIALSDMEQQAHNADNAAVHGVDKGLYNASSAGLADPHGQDYIKGINSSGIDTPTNPEHLNTSQTGQDQPGHESQHSGT